MQCFKFSEKLNTSKQHITFQLWCDIWYFVYHALQYTFVAQLSSHVIDNYLLLHYYEPLGI